MPPVIDADDAQARILDPAQDIADRRVRAVIHHDQLEVHATLGQSAVADSSSQSGRVFHAGITMLTSGGEAAIEVGIIGVRALRWPAAAHEDGACTPRSSLVRWDAAADTLRVVAKL